MPAPATKIAAAKTKAEQFFDVFIEFTPVIDPHAGMACEIFGASRLLRI
jgi:hypothetical protein